MPVIARNIVSVFVSIGISLGLLSAYWSDTDISLRALVVRESVRIVCKSNLVSGGGSSSFGGIDTSKISVFIPPIGYTNEKHDVDGLSIEVLKDKDSENSEKAILQLHGVAYIFNMNDLYRITALRWSKRSGGADIVTVDYRVAPEYTYPCALEDALKTWDWMLEQGYKAEDIIVIGDSAGGNLALALGLTLRDAGRDMPLAMVLMSPWADLSASGESNITNTYKDPMFGLPEGTPIDTDRTAEGNAYAGDTPLNDALLSPAFAEYDGFCPMLIQCGTYEVLQSDSETVYQKACDAGVEATLTEYTGMWHMFQLGGDLYPESTAAWAESEEFIMQQFYAQ